MTKKSRILSKPIHDLQIAMVSMSLPLREKITWKIDNDVEPDNDILG